MTLWEIIIEVVSMSGIISPRLEKYFYIVGCDSEKRARKLATEIHMQKFSHHDNLKIESVSKLELIDITTAVWYNKCEVHA